MAKIELVSPAGNIEKLKTALAFGADAVYCGIPEFSLRARINKFDIKSLKEGVEIAHKLKKKVYVTVNIYAHNQHLKTLPKYLRELAKIKVDAVIISDPGVLSLAKKYAKILPAGRQVKIHLSTQANTTNVEAVKFWYQQGVKRVVLAREATLAEIKEIHKKFPKMELEVFVHGAMCMSYSGRCILSKYYTNRSANLGDCTQPCRWEYDLLKTSNTSSSCHSRAGGNPRGIAKNKKDDLDGECGAVLNGGLVLQEKSRPGQFLPIEEDQHGSYILNSKDLCLLPCLNELKKAGVTSLKIEGRAKSINYVANTTKVYRQVLDKKMTAKKGIQELKKCANRDFTTGFLFGRDKWENKIDSSHSECDWEFVGEIVSDSLSVIPSLSKNPFQLVKAHNVLRVGDTVEAVPPNDKNFTFKIKQMIDPKTSEAIEEVHGGQNRAVLIKFPKKVGMRTILRKHIKQNHC